ncbi:MAG: YfhO family protein, partial [Nitrospinae bacterium]|nr:YfhO family protein [Nitrospinota bacterium]
MTTKGDPEVKGILHRRHAADFGACAFLLLLFVFFFAPVLFEGKTFFFRDVLSFAYPMKRFIWESFGAGTLPFWWPHIFCGVPFLALMDPAVFYPLNIFLLADNFTTAYNLLFLSQHLLLMVSVYALARTWGLSAGASMISASTALLGGYFLALSSIHNHFQSAVFFPLVLLCFHKFLHTGRARYFVFWVLALVAQILGGSPENCIFTVGILAGYALILTPTDARIKGARRSMSLLGGGILLALGLTAIQLLPTYALLGESVRSGGVPFESVAAWSLDWKLFSGIFAPEPQASLMGQRPQDGGYFISSAYMGIVPAFFLLAGFFLTKKKEVRFWVSVFWIGIFFALGQHNPVYEFFYNWVPMFDLFRYPQKFLFLSSFSLVFLAGHGIDGIMESVSSGKLALRKFIIMLAGVAGCIFLISWLTPQAGVLHAGGLLLLFGIVVSAFCAGKLRPALFKGLILFLVVADLLLKNTSLVPLIDHKFYEEPPPLASKVGTQSENYRVYSGALEKKTIASRENFPRTSNLLFDHLSLRERLYPNLGTIYDLAYADGLLGLELLEPFLWTEILLKSPPEKRRRILKRSNVKYWVTEENEIPPSADRPLGLKTVEVFDDVLPRAFLVAEARQGEEPRLVNTYLDESFDPRSTVLLGEPVSLKTQNDFSGTIENITYGPNRVSVRTIQNGSGFLVLLDSYFPGWKVIVDGKEDRILRANHFFRAVQLSPGKHTVTFTYEPVGFKLGLIISVSTLIIFIVLV